MPLGSEGGADIRGWYPGLPSTGFEATEPWSPEDPHTVLAEDSWDGAAGGGCVVEEVDEAPAWWTRQARYARDTAEVQPRSGRDTRITDAR